MADPEDNHIEKTGPKEIAWFLGLWIAGVAVILIAGSIIKLVI